jgi:hypothetical protein
MARLSPGYIVKARRGDPPLRATHRFATPRHDAEEEDGDTEAFGAGVSALCFLPPPYRVLLLGTDRGELLALRLPSPAGAGSLAREPAARLPSGAAVVALACSADGGQVAATDAEGAVFLFATEVPLMRSPRHQLF